MQGKLLSTSKVLSYIDMTVTICFSIFVAFILEAFILEYSLQKTGRLESEVESKIKELGLGIGQ